MNYFSGCIPFIILSIVLFGFIKKINIFDCFLEGVKIGLKNTYNIFPSILALVFAVNILKSGGCLDLLKNIFSPICNLINIPSEIIPLCFIKPLSGSGANAYLNQILTDYGPDSVIGKISSIICASTETTFYAVAVYYGAIKIKNTRYTLPVALLADFISMALACFLILSF